jgi:DNA-binding NarL/FixJ family response regulator
MDDAARPRSDPAAVSLEQAYTLHTLVLADDHPVVRSNLKKLLNRETDFQLVAEADNGLEVVRLVESFRPDLLVTDLAMPGLDGLEVTHAVRRVSPHTRVIVVSVHREEPYVLQALRCGASAYVLKSSSRGDLVPAARAVLAGKRFLSAPFSSSLLD